MLKFLNGNYDVILKELEEKMNTASENLEFERAIEYRELINSVKKIAQKQKITDSRGEDRDILAAASEGEDAVVQVFFIRGGRLIGRDHFYLRISSGEKIIRYFNDSFIKQYLAGNALYSGRTDDSGGNQRQRIDRNVAYLKAWTESDGKSSEKRNERKTGRIGL